MSARRLYILHLDCMYENGLSKMHPLVTVQHSKAQGLQETGPCNVANYNLKVISIYLISMR